MTLTADPHVNRAASDGIRSGLAKRLLLGDGSEPRWARPGLLVLLLATAGLYLWALGSTGWANDYYAAAVQAGTQDWKAWLFGSLDPGNSITVDKPPGAMWVMVLFGRLFGFSAFTMLLPQALMGVGSVAVLYAMVRRWSGPAAGLMAGTVLALTPVAALMFRYNNPDALLVLLLIVAAYCTVRATENGSVRWMALAGCAIGFGFLTKMLQAFLVAPGLALVFLVAAPGGLWLRIGKLLVGGAALIASAGWYVALVHFWPAGSRPYIGGSTDNDLLQLALGYNGIQRVLGGQGPGAGRGGGPGPGGGPGGGAGGPGGLFFGGEPSIGRLFGPSMGTEISWLLPVALIGLIAGLWFTRRAPRTDRVRAGLLLWGGWLLVTGAVFSFMSGIVHPYYTIALAPAVAALIGISVRELWRDKESVAPRAVLAAMIAAAGIWGFILLARTPEWLPPLRWIVLVGTIITAAVVLVGVHRLGKATVVVAAAAMLFSVGGTTAYTIETVLHSNGKNGPIVTSGPQKAGFGFPGGAGEPGDGGGPGGPGGHGPGREVTPALANLVKGADTTRWAAAGIGSFTASSLELKTGASVMAIGGFTGSDNSPTLAQFQQYVAGGDIRYFIAGDREGPRHPESGNAKEITSWVKAHYRSTNVGGTTVYDFTAPLDAH